MSLIEEIDYGTPRSKSEAMVTLTIDGNTITVLEDLCNTMKFGSLCALGGFTPYPVMSALTHFPEDFGASPKRLQAAE